MASCRDSRRGPYAMLKTPPASPSLVWSALRMCTSRGLLHRLGSPLPFGFGGGTGSRARYPDRPDHPARRLTLAWRGVWIARIIIPIVAIGLTAYAVYSSVHPVPPAPNRGCRTRTLALIVVGVVIGLVAGSRRVPAKVSVQGPNAGRRGVVVKSTVSRSSEARSRASGSGALVCGPGVTGRGADTRRVRR